MKDLFTALANELNRKRDLVLVTIIRNEGSAPPGLRCENVGLIEWLIRWNDRWRRCGVSVHPSCQGTDRDHRRPKRFLFSQRKRQCEFGHGLRRKSAGAIYAGLRTG